MTALAELLDALGAAPALPGACCRGAHELFDKTIHSDRGAPNTSVSTARRKALDICATCPALAACTAWIESLPPRHRPHGVVAGKVNTGQRGRREPSSASLHLSQMGHPTTKLGANDCRRPMTVECPLCGAVNLLDPHQHWIHCINCGLIVRKPSSTNTTTTKRTPA